MLKSSRLQLTGIRKTFGPTVALDGVSLNVASGTVHALLGENGAGKSTLLRILSGLLTPDAGTIQVGNSETRFGSARDAHRAGVATAAQELALVPHLTVAQNLFLGMEPRSRLGLVSNNDLARRTRQLCEEFDVTGLDPDIPVSALALGARQQLELLRVFSRRGKVLLLDEPTAALGAHEVEWLFAQVNRARASGLTIVFVSHRMPEVRELCDSVSVLRDGRHVATLPVSQASDQELVRMMMGRESNRIDRARNNTTGEVLLRASGVAASPSLEDATFVVHAGEVVGVAALQGHGQLELFMTIFGEQRRAGGDLTIAGSPSRINAPHRAVHGRPAVALVPEDRKAEGVMLRMSGKANLAITILDKCSRWGWVNRRQERRLAQEIMQAMGVRAAALHEDVASLSGGNQQKIAIGKWLKRDALLFLMYDPTRGVDVGTKSDIYALMKAITDENRAILLYSTDLEELLAVSDRILVMYRGRFVAEFQGATCDRTDVMAAMLGTGQAAAAHQSQPKEQASK